MFLAHHRRLLLLRLRPRSARGVSSSCARFADDDEKKVSTHCDLWRWLRSPFFHGLLFPRIHNLLPLEQPGNHVTLSFARSSGAGGQNVNKVNTKVDMRFKVMAAQWLPLRARLKLFQTEKNRINNEGELVVTSTKNRTQKGNIEDALEKIQEIIDEACYVPPPPSEEIKNRIIKLAAAEDQKRLLIKKQIANKKSSRRERF